MSDNPRNLTLDIERTGNTVVVRCHGRLVADTDDVLYYQVKQLFPDSKRIVLDLTDGTGEYEGQKVCAIHLRPVETIAEENYFFKLSQYTDKLLEYYREHPDFVQPASARNEVVSFVTSIHTTRLSGPDCAIRPTRVSSVRKAGIGSDRCQR